MEWLESIPGFWLERLKWFVGLAVAFAVLTRLTPCNRGMSWWKSLRAAGTDIIYWFVVPLFVRFGWLALYNAGLLLLYGGRGPDFLPVKGLPLWLQCVLILLIQDVLLYAVHRAFHTRAAWKFHAVHHSPQEVDWTTTVRFHPVNSVLSFVLADVAVLMLGFPFEAIAALIPFNILYSAMVHANLNWTFGPLKYVLASPVFHRWHHTTEAEGLNKNFASTFPVLDVIFGTFYMPAGRLPEEFGNGEADYPQGFWGQFLHPFRNKKAPPPQVARAPAPRRRKRRAA
jgi:sterol desaturase/sphingolipid hydroxylase (fatty acid hydroxylase superfamily)